MVSEGDDMNWPLIEAIPGVYRWEECRCNAGISQRVVDLAWCKFYFQNGDDRTQMTAGQHKPAGLAVPHMDYFWNMFTVIFTEKGGLY